jgi:hypothetical protein
MLTFEVQTSNNPEVRRRLQEYPGMTAQREALFQPIRAAIAPMHVRPTDAGPPGQTYTRGWQAMSTTMSEFMDSVERRYSVLLEVRRITAPRAPPQNAREYEEARKRKMEQVFSKQLVETAVMGYSLITKSEQGNVATEMREQDMARQRKQQMTNDLARADTPEARQALYEQEMLLRELDGRVARREASMRFRTGMLAPALKTLETAIARAEEAATLHAEKQAELDMIRRTYRTAVEEYEARVKDIEMANAEIVRTEREYYSKALTRIIEWFRLRAERLVDACAPHRARPPLGGRGAQEGHRGGRAQAHQARPAGDRREDPPPLPHPHGGLAHQPEGHQCAGED